MKKARQALRTAREASGDTEYAQKALKLGWSSLTQAHHLLAEIPIDAATDPVLTRQLAVQRYATALLVRLRRLVRNEPGAADFEGDDLDEDGED